MTNSYSSLETFKQCPYKYKLIYLDKNYIDSSSIATEIGTLIHSTEEKIGNLLKNNKDIDYDELKLSIIARVETIKNKYFNDYYSLDKSNRTYEDKIKYYLDYGIYRLEKRLHDNPNLSIITLEKEFYLNFKNHIIHGFIDRIFYDKNLDTYILEDIKTYSKTLSNSDLKVPLQHVIYSLALKSIGIEKIICTYDLPFCDAIQYVDVNYLNKGINELSNVFDEIKMSDFHPNPSPLCHWCIFSETYNNQPDKAKNLCPYFSLWTRDNKTFSVNKKWIKNNIC